MTTAKITSQPQLYSEIVIQWSPKMEITDPKVNSFPENVLYQLYGDSHLYGRDVLLYIGKTNRKVEERLSEHIKSVFGFVNNLSISVGKIINYPVESLEVPESILIANHKPSFNKEYIHLLADGATDSKIIIINNGHCLSLKSSCTNYWWVKQHTI